MTTRPIEDRKSADNQLWIPSLGDLMVYNREALGSSKVWIVRYEVNNLRPSTRRYLLCELDFTVAYHLL